MENELIFFGQPPRKILTHTHTELLISRFVDNRLWNDLAGSVSPSLSEESSPPGDVPPKFFALLLPDAILQCRHFQFFLFIYKQEREYKLMCKR